MRTIIILTFAERTQGSKKTKECNNKIHPIITSIRRFKARLKERSKRSLVDEL